MKIALVEGGERVKIALVTTTIGTPTEMLELYRQIGEVKIIVVSDLKTPKIWKTEALVMSPDYQRSLGYACSELIGWNCIQRRNIGFLEALRWGADVIISVDDDNYPLEKTYSWNFIRLFGSPFTGLHVSGDDYGNQQWFDYGQLLSPPIRARGIPINALPLFKISPCPSAWIGAAQGIILGDPDCSAIDRAATAILPECTQTHECLRAGVVFLPSYTNWTVFNTQNTAFSRTIAPAMFCPPGIGRYDDIVASLVSQRIMRELNLAVHFGPPFVYQQRNQHDLRRDLREEAWGVDHVTEVAQCLDDTSFPHPEALYGARWGTLEMVRHLYRALATILPERSVEAALAWCEDVEKIGV